MNTEFLNSNASPTARILIIGNEILNGQVQDTNIKFLTTELHKLGISVLGVKIIGDNKADIIEAVLTMKEKCNYVFTTGGIGPTHDDITSEAIAEAFGVNIIRNPEAVQLLHQKYPDDQLHESRLCMADMPEGASIIYNSATLAPGYIMENVYVMAGIPHIMQAMFTGLKGQLRKGSVFHSMSLLTTLPESVLAIKFGELQARYPRIMMGSYPGQTDGKWHTKLMLMCTDDFLLNKAYGELEQMVSELS
jgi:molybdenum cofactor synthesis domain-containing protein